jgi:hypothetical protein
MIDLTIHPEGLENAIKRARENNIVIPTNTSRYLSAFPG